MTAPLDGVITRIEAAPHEPVQGDQVLFRLDSTLIGNRREVAAKAVAVAEAELLSARQLSFSDSSLKSRIPFLHARVAERKAELAHADELLTRTVVRARHDGIAVFGDPNDWNGRPVQVGERVMLIADPARAELEIRVPMDDAIVFEEGAPVSLFLNAKPLTPVEAVVMRASYDATETLEGTLAYRLRARFADEHSPPPRIGLKGTARISGRRTSLFYYLFRRPLTALRQSIGY